MPSRRFMLAAAAGALAAGAAAPVRPAQAHPHEALAAAQAGDIERQIAAVRNALKDAAAAKDVARLRALYADAYTHIHASGKADGKDARIVALVAGDPVIETAPASEISIRIHGPDMAIVTGRSPVLNREDKKTYDLRWMQVYTRASGDWQLAASQATRLPATS